MMNDLESTIKSFDYKPTTRLVYGVGALSNLADYVKQLGAQRVLIVTDIHIVEAGHVSKAVDQLTAHGINVAVFDQVHENPTTEDVQAAVQVAQSHQTDLIIGLGGGSSLDTAKGCNFIYTNGGTMHDYWGEHKPAPKPMLPLIAIPTTAGTGSECQSYALISDAETHAKMACGDPKAAAKIAILDPLLTLTQPQSVAACTGIDTITHAVESVVTTRRNPLSMLFAKQAFAFAQANLETVLNDGDNIEARGAMQLAAAYAGMAIENSMLGAAHSTANPLTANYDVVHGWAVGLMMPHVIRFNAHEPNARKIYAELAVYSELATHRDDLDDAVDALVLRVEQLLDIANVPPSIATCNVQPDMIPTLAQQAATQWTAQFNPRPLTEDDFISLYTQAMSERAVQTA